MTMPTTPDVALPKAMIEVAARALHDADCTATVIAGSYGERATAILAAALGVCQVREESHHRRERTRAA